MRYMATILASIFLAAVVAVGASVLDPAVSEAASGGGYVKRCGGGRILLKANEKRTFTLHNNIRRDHDLRLFCVHPKLQRAARAHSREMIERDYFSHDSYNGQSFARRIASFGYNYRAIGENIAYGSGSYGSPSRIVRGWMNSPGHRANILNGKYREIGIGTYTGTYKSYDHATMYTADFGTRF